MLAVYLSPLYILVNIYILLRLLYWLGACNEKLKLWKARIPVILCYSFFALAMLIAFWLPMGQLRRILKLIGNYWLGTMLYIVLTIVIADLAALILKHCKFINQEKLRTRKVLIIVGIICTMIITGVSVGGVINAHHIRTTNYTVTVDKDGGPLDSVNIVLVADLHLGYNIGCSQMEQMVEKINAAQPDLVVIAGDIFDNEYEALDDPERLITILQKIQSKYGVYACYGNHDIEEKILAGFTFSADQGVTKVSAPEMDDFLKRANIKLLMDEQVLIGDSFYLYGRRDEERPGRGSDGRKTAEEICAELDLSKPVIVIDHEPKELQELADAGVDLDLCGHTHDGQMFPANLTSRLIWENCYGYLKKGNMQNIVTSGVGLFGPDMRVATIPEICKIEVQFKNAGEAS